jgi:hypothetical protein
LIGDYTVSSYPNDGTLATATTRLVSGIGAHPDQKTYYFADSRSDQSGASIRVIRLDNPGNYTSGTVSTLFNNTFQYIGDLVLHTPTRSLVFTDTAARVVYRYYLETGMSQWCIALFAARQH